VKPLVVTVVLVVCVAGCSSQHVPGNSNNSSGASMPPPPPPKSNLIAAENALPGDSGWTIDSDDGDQRFGAYARPLSLEPGQRLSVRASAPDATPARFAVYRLGWYGGQGGRRYGDGSFTIGPQAPYTLDPATGRIECSWNESFGVDVGAAWTPGYYVVRIELPDGRARYAPFIVHDHRAADVIAVLPTATDQSYNAWGGESLYVDTRGLFPIGHAYEVSYDRPFDAAMGAGVSFASSGPALRWLEANGYDVTYLADHDIDGDVTELTRGKLVLALAHDEYWSRAMRDHYEAARAAGTSLGFLGANTAFWQVRFENAPDGMPYRHQIGYKEAATLDPLYGVDNPDVTDAFAGPILRRPENALLGVRTLDWFMVDFAWVVTDADNWVYEGTGLDNGALMPGLVGLEADGIVDNGATPAGIVAVAQSPTIGGDQPAINTHRATYYLTDAGNFVFSAASIRFPTTLQGPRAVAGAQRMIANLIARATGRPVPGETVPAPSTLANADWTGAASSVSTVAGTGSAGYVDGPAASAQFSGPLGVALLPDGSLVIADSGNHRLRRLDPPETGAARAVSTVAGIDLPPPDGRPLPAGAFQHLWGVATAADGTIWTADPKLARVTRVAPDGTLTAFDGPSIGFPSGISVAPDGTIWTVDIYTGGVRSMTPDGTVTSQLASATDGALGYPTGISVDASGAWIVDSGRHALRHLTPDGTLTTMAGNFVSTPFADGDGHHAGIEPLIGLAHVGDQWIVADSGNHRLRRFTPGTGAADSVLHTYAGRAAHQAMTDGPADQAELGLPTGLAWDGARGLLYVADTANGAIRVVRP
jgi:sugar lactone lactonase YvrE